MLTSPPPLGSLSKPVSLPNLFKRRNHPPIDPQGHDTGSMGGGGGEPWLLPSLVFPLPEVRSPLLSRLDHPFPGHKRGAGGGGEGVPAEDPLLTAAKPPTNRGGGQGHM